MKNKILLRLPYLVVILISLITIYPLFIQGFFPMHDDTQPARVFEMAEALRDGQFPVRLVRDFGYGYGYPLFNFYGPFPYYIGALFTLLGFGAIESAKIMMGIGMILSGITMYILAKKLTGNISAGIIASTAFLLAPYHAVQLYVRGAVGELYAYAFLPVPLLGWYLILKKQFIKGISVGSMGLFLIFTSHTVSALMVFYMSLLLLLVLLICFIHKKISVLTLLTFAASIALGLTLAAFFLIPSFFEQYLTSVSLLVREGSDFRSHFVYLSQLWDSAWGFAGSAPGWSDGMSFKIGKLHLILAVLASIVLIYQHARHKYVKSHWLLVIGNWLLVLLSVFFMLSVSKPLWETMPFFPFIQYPWRFLNITLLGLCLILAIGIKYSPIRINILLTVLITLSFIFLNQKLFVPSFIFASRDSMYTSWTNLSGNLSKISDEYLPFLFSRDQYPGNLIWRTDIKSVLPPSFNNLDIQSNYRSYNIMVQTGGDYTAPLAYFPGWMVKVDGVDGKIREHEGLTAIELKEGIHIVEFFLTQTPIEKVANLISLLTFILLLYLSLFLKRKEHEKALG